MFSQRVGVVNEQRYCGMISERNGRGMYCEYGVYRVGSMQFVWMDQGGLFQRVRGWS